MFEDFDPGMGGCRRCSARDYGFDLPDTRETYYLKCQCRGDQENHNNSCKVEGCKECWDPYDTFCDQCEKGKNKVTINIVRDWEECGCGLGSIFTVRFVVVGPDGVKATVPTQELAEIVVEKLYPQAESYVDHAWESERHLRMIGG